MYYVIMSPCLSPDILRHNISLLSPSASWIQERLTMWIPQAKWRSVQNSRRFSPVMWWLNHRSIPSCLQVLTGWQRKWVSWYQSDADNDVQIKVSVGKGRDRKETEVRSCQGVRTDVLYSHYWMFAFWNPSNSSLWKGVRSHCCFLCHCDLK